ncbi:hypothetical protein B0H14DRAFT_2593870 [Mycena olivaceomarginata]|nr:hypothetical protein B0H14DRAFT_2593870 [Mycena olivaceomarginata]
MSQYRCSQFFSGPRRQQSQPIATESQAKTSSRLAGRVPLPEKSQADKPPRVLLRGLSALQLRPPRTRLRPVRRAPSALRLLQTEQESTCAGYQRAMVLSFGANCGTDVNHLGCLQSLAKVLQVDPILERVRAIRVANVNLVDLIVDWGTSEGRSPLPTIFGTSNGLRVYTQTTRKPRERALYRALPALLISKNPHEHSKFFRLQKLVWTPSMGDLRAPGTSDAGNTWTAKLKGDYELPSSIKIPEFAESPDGEERFRLPHTLAFTDRASWGSIEYYLELRISRGKLRSDDSLRTAPTSLFLVRILDPDGWQALEPVQVRGKLFRDRAVNAKCTVFLAKPLCYTRNTSIPCAMTIERDDSQVADVLASIKSSALYLRRCVRCTLGSSSTNVSPCGQRRRTNQATLS